MAFKTFFSPEVVVRIKTSCVAGILTLVGGAAQVAHAEDNKVVSAADSTKIGLNFRSEINRNDNGLQKVKDTKAPSASTTLAVQYLQVKLKGNLNKETEYSFRFNLLDPYPTKGGPLDYGFGTHWFTDMVGFSIGKQRIMQGGWDTFDTDYRSHLTGAYANNLAFSSYEYAAALHIKAAGVVNIQLLNDKVTPAAPTGGIDASWNKKANPTLAIGWLGDFGVVKPLLEYGTFDNQKSMYIDVGVKAEVSNLLVRFDYRNEAYSHRVSDAADAKAKSKVDKGNAYTLLASYDVNQTVTPWGYFSAYDKKEYVDTKTNSFKAASATSSAAPVWDDNKTVWGVGVDVVGPLGKGWTPYLAYVSTSGKFLDEQKTGSKVTRTDGQVRLGVLGNF